MAGTGAADSGRMFLRLAAVQASGRIRLREHGILCHHMTLLANLLFPKRTFSANWKLDPMTEPWGCEAGRSVGVLVGVGGARRWLAGEGSRIGMR